MMTWTAPARTVAAVAALQPSLTVRCVIGTASPVWSVVAQATTEKGNPQHYAVATFIGKAAQKEAHAYRTTGFAKRVAKLAGK